MRMFGTGIDPQVAELHPRERSPGQHALDGLLDDPLGKFALEDRARRALLDAADIAGVMAIDLVLALPAGQHDLFRVDDDDVVAIVDMRSEGRLVLSAQPHGHDAGETTDDKTGRVDHDPLLLDIGGLGRKSLHDMSSMNGPHRAQRWGLITPAAQPRSTPSPI